MKSNVHNSEAACWISSARYAQPLDTTAAKKWLALAALARPLYVIGFADSPRPARFTQHAHFYLLPLLPLAPLRYAALLLTAPFMALWLIMRRDVRILIAQSPYEGAAAALVKQIARLFGTRVKLIVENHGDFKESLFMQRRVRLASLYRWVMRLAAGYALRHADALRAISSFTCQQIQSAAPGKPLMQIMTWTDASAFSETPRSLPAERSRDFVYPGVLIPRKGVHILLDAFVQIEADAHLWLVGAPDNRDYTQQLHEQVQRLGLTERVTFVGAVTQRELAAYFGQARAAVLPSLSEGLGRVVIEAMLCGTPVIGSDTGGIPDMITDGENGWLVPPGDVDALASALRKALETDDITAMGERARAFAQQHFSPEAYVAGHRQLFELVSDKRVKN